MPGAMNGIGASAKAVAAADTRADGPLILAERLDLTAAAPLAEAIRARRDGGPLRLDAGAVDHLGGLCLQVLLAAAADWRARGPGWTIAPRSAAFDRALAVFGIDPGRIGADAATATPRGAAA